MANFTDAELEAYVSRYVRADVKTDRTSLGPLNTDYTFAEARELAASTLVFNPSAVFYLLSLAANRVNRDVIQAIDYLDDIIVAIGEVGRDTVEVSQTNLLADAAAALLDAERTIEARNAIATRPFDRYTRALDVFTNGSLTPNVRRLGPGFPATYELVRPPQQAQADMKTVVAELRDLHVAVVAEATQLTEALSEFLAAQLPLESIQNTVPKVRRDLRSLKTQFDSSARDEAIEITRDAFLRIQAGKAVVTNLTSISDPRDSRMASSALSSDRAQAASTPANPAATSTPAKATAFSSAPYEITPTTNEVRLWANGGSPQLITLPLSTRGSIVGSNDEPYDIHDSSAAKMTASSAGPYTVPSAPDNVFDIYVDGDGYRALLTAGSRTAAQVAAEINAATRIDGSPGAFDDVGTASDAAGSLEISHDTAGAFKLVLGDAAALNTALGFANEQEGEGQAANNQLRLWVEDRAVLTIDLTNGAARTASQVAADIAGFYLEGAAEVVEVEGGTITVPKITVASYGEGSAIRVASSTPTQEEAVKTLGFSEGEEDRGRYTRLDEVYDALQDLNEVSVETSSEVMDSGGNGEAILDGGITYKLRLPAGTLTSSTADEILWVANGANTGWYPIQSILSGAFDDVVVGRAFPVVTGSEAQGLEWSIVANRFTLVSTDIYATSELDIKYATANNALGLGSGARVGSVSGVRIKEGDKFLSFSREDVAIGDRLLLSDALGDGGEDDAGGSPVLTEHTVTDVTDDGYQIEVTPEVPGDMVGAEYRIDGSGAVAYEEFSANLNSWFTSVLAPSKFSEDILELERNLNPLLVNRNPSAALVGSAEAAANSLREVYTQSDPLGLTQILASFTTYVVPRIDALLDMLKERGMDRAHDLLLLGEFETFFSANKDGASYGGNLLEKMRAIAQNDVPQDRGLAADNVDDVPIGTFEDTDPEYDFSDQDDETGEPYFDDVPDMDEDEDVLNRSF